MDFSSSRNKSIFEKAIAFYKAQIVKLAFGGKLIAKVDLGFNRRSVVKCVDCMFFSG